VKRSDIARLLPSVYQRTLEETGPLAALLAVMEELHAPAETSLAGLSLFLDPRRAPEPFVPFLAQWVGLMPLITGGDRWQTDALDEWPGELEPLRELVARAASLSRCRGTTRGLVHFLETATGQAGIRIDERVGGSEGRVRPFHVRIVAPAVLASKSELVERIIESEKPAYVTYEVEYTD
jgi:phage tail-like protein